MRRFNWTLVCFLMGILFSLPGPICYADNGSEAFRFQANIAENMTEMYERNVYVAVMSEKKPSARVAGLSGTVNTF